MHENADDESLAAHASQGDEAAFSALFNRHYAMIFAYAQRICLDANLAEDVAQETFIKAARELGGGRFRGSLKAWLYRVARNGAIDQLRRRQREKCHLPLDAERDAEIPTSPASAESENGSLETALAQLHPEWRAAIALVYFEGRNHAEAARLLGCAETTVSWRIFQAKRKLRRLLGKKEALR